MPRVSATSAPIRQGTTSLTAPEEARVGGSGADAPGYAVMIVSVGAESYWSESAAGEAVDRGRVQDEIAGPSGTRRHIKHRRLDRRRCRRAGVLFQGADLRAVGQHD